MDEKLVIEHVEIYCAHGGGPAICPLCGKPCEQDLADDLNGRLTWKSQDGEAGR